MNQKVEELRGENKEIRQLGNQIVKDIEKVHEKSKKALEDVTAAQALVDVMKTNLYNYINSKLKPYQERLERLPEAKKPFIKSAMIQVFYGERWITHPWGNAEDWEVIVVPIAPGNSIEPYTSEYTGALQCDPLLKSHLGDVNRYRCYAVLDKDKGWKIVASQKVGDETNHPVPVYYLMVSKLE